MTKEINYLKPLNENKGEIRMSNIIKIGNREDEEFSESKLDLVAKILEKQPEHVTGILTDDVKIVLIEMAFMDTKAISRITKEISDTLKLDYDRMGAMPVRDLKPYESEGVYIVTRN